MEKTLSLVVSKMGCLKLTYYNETLTRVRGGKTLLLPKQPQNTLSQYWELFGNKHVMY